MIKGQNLSDLLIIRDTSPGATSLWIILIMIICIYITYNIAYLFWLTKTVEKMKRYESILEKGPQKQMPTVREPKTTDRKPSRPLVATPKKSSEEMEDMKVFNTLKRKRW